MIDIKFLRENPEIVKEGCRKKGLQVNIDRILEIDKKRREVMQALEGMLAEKNKVSKQMSVIREEKEKRKIILQMQELDKNSDRLNRDLKSLQKKFDNLMYQIPNLPLPEVPLGRDERDNIVLKEIGEKPKFSFEPRDYLTIAEQFDLIDVKRAAKTSGTRFAFLKKEAVLLELALINFAFNKLIDKGFIAVIPPVLIKPEPFRAMGYLDRGEEEVYYLPKDNLYLIGTSEQIIGPMHNEEIFEEKELPKRYLGFSSCFRREAGAYGRDTKGILRVHQFEKIEMFSFTKPEDSEEEHKFLLSCEEELMKELGIPYRVIQMCTGDLGTPAAAKFDIEAWLPGQNQGKGEYRETHSTSNCTDFQARRLNIRYRNKENKLTIVHTLNGTALAIGRTIIAILENYQQKDGSVIIPKVLMPYLGDKRIIGGDH